ncbi:DUF3881 family protein [Defluviitalea phaphyphila]|uniref:DUF3881 family protein n=1 Tax=Defluviitalea phaphyphila TaxID=1473580 RepID=UPI000731CBC7|nr:DUF3881 family protein [Defluviitalea phaphyphila]
METYISAVGFKNIKKKIQWDKLIDDIFENPTNQFVKFHDQEHVFIEYYKEYGKRMGIILRGFLDNDGDIEVESCDPYMEAKYIIDVSQVEVEEEDDYFCFAICEEEKTGIEIVFQVQNVVEYLEVENDKNTFVEGIKIVGLSSKGTIILPIEKTESDIEYEKEQKKWREYLLKRIQQGDKEAEEILNIEEEELSKIIEERLKYEDFLSVVESYFIPVEYLDATYSVLGVIKEIEEIENKRTKEKVYWMLVETMGMTIEIVINKKELVGTPLVGMRFMGICFMQGKVLFNTNA